MAYDGAIALHGVDTSNDPGLLSNSLSAIDAVNRTFRGGVSRTRDPFISFDLIFDTDENKDTFENGNISGIFPYRKINNFIQPHLIVAVGNKLLAGRVYSSQISFKCIYDEIDPQWLHSFFVQAEEVLVWQNGKQTPQVWDGLSSITQSSKEAVESVGKSNPIPIGNLMTYAHGRIFVATEDNIVYAGDHIYSQGFGKNKTVTNFEESTYPVSGDGFGAYSQIGRITGLGVMPRHPEPNGHGEVIVFGQDGAWSIDPSNPRDQWLDLPIQQVLLTGRGNIAPESITPVNNDIFYRCSDKTISSIKHSLTERNQAWTDRSLSREVQRYLDFDNNELAEYTSGIFANNRLIMSCASRMENSNGYGKHRYGLGMVSLDLDRGNTANQIDVGFSWDGLWTGPRVTGMAKLPVDGGERHLFASYDTDNKNRIYYLGSDKGFNDVIEREEQKIKGFWIIGDLFNSNDPKSTPVNYSLSMAAAFVSDVNDEAKISMSYRPDRHPLWTELMEENVVGYETSCEEKGDHLNEDVPFTECNEDPGETKRPTSYPFLSIKPYGDVIGSESPDRTATRNAVSHSLHKGYSFQIKINTEGVITVNRVVAEANASKDVNLTNAVAFRKDLCYINREKGCNETEEYFNYLF